MSSLSRRNFLYAGGAVAAGAAALASPGGHVAAAAAPTGAALAAPGLADEVLQPEGEDQMVMYVSNTGAGEITVLTEGHEVVFHDPQLVARVQRAAKKASV